MREPHGEGIAIRSDPESCVNVREDGGEALTGAHAGWVLSREIATQNQGADAVMSCGRQRRLQRSPMLQKNPARSKTPSMHGNIVNRDWEIPRLPARADRIGKSKDEGR